MVTALAILTVAAIGLYARAQTGDETTGRIAIVAGPDSTALVGEVPDRGDLAQAGLREGDRLLRIGDGPMTRQRLRESRGNVHLEGPRGDTLRVQVLRGGDTLSVGIVRGGRAIADARAFGLSDGALRRGLGALHLLAVLSFVVAGVVLFARSRARGYLASLATAMLAASGAFGFVALAEWDGGGMQRGVAATLALVAAAVFVSAIPAVIAALVRFPDGRYVPRWTRHARGLTVLGLVAMVAVAVVGAESEGRRWLIWVATAPALGVVALPLVGLWRKYRRAEDTVVRQQMKWVLLPLGAFSAVALASLGGEVFPALDSSESASGYLFLMAVAALAYLALAAIPLGVLAGVFRFRPWDADLWIARSAAVGVATLGLAAVFAAGAELIRVALRSSFGASADPIAAALAAVLSLFAFTPVREWFTRRAERELQRTREILGERLPLVLAGRQVVASPAEIGRVAIRGLQDALQTDRAAVIDLDPEGWEVVAASGVAPEAALAWADATLDAAALPGAPEQVWEDPAFVLRVPLRSAEDEVVGVLALGTHGKGRGYSTAERDAVAGMARPLAEALRVAERREEAEAARAARLARLLDRLG